MRQLRSVLLLSRQHTPMSSPVLSVYSDRLSKFSVCIRASPWHRRPNIPRCTTSPNVHKLPSSNGTSRTLGVTLERWCFCSSARQSSDSLRTCCTFSNKSSTTCSKLPCISTATNNNSCCSTCGWRRSDALYTDSICSHGKFPEDSCSLENYSRFRISNSSSHSSSGLRNSSTSGHRCDSHRPNVCSSTVGCSASNGNSTTLISCSSSSHMSRTRPSKCEDSAGACVDDSNSNTTCSFRAFCLVSPPFNKRSESPSKKYLGGILRLMYRRREVICRSNSRPTSLHVNKAVSFLCCSLLPTTCLYVNRSVSLMCNCSSTSLSSTLTHCGVYALALYTTCALHGYIPHESAEQRRLSQGTTTRVNKYCDISLSGERAIAAVAAITISSLASEDLTSATSEQRACSSFGWSMPSPDFTLLTTSATAVAPSLKTSTLLTTSAGAAAAAPATTGTLSHSCRDSATSGDIASLCAGVSSSPRMHLLFDRSQNYHHHHLSSRLNKFPIVGRCLCLLSPVAAAAAFSRGTSINSFTHSSPTITSNSNFSTAQAIDTAAPDATSRPILACAADAYSPSQYCYHSSSRLPPLSHVSRCSVETSSSLLWAVGSLRQRPPQKAAAPATRSDMFTSKPSHCKSHVVMLPLAVSASATAVRCLRSSSSLSRSVYIHTQKGFQTVVYPAATILCPTRKSLFTSDAKALAGVAPSIVSPAAIMSTAAAFPVPAASVSVRAHTVSMPAAWTSTPALSNMAIPTCLVLAACRSMRAASMSVPAACMFRRADTMSMPAGSISTPSACMLMDDACETVSTASSVPLPGGSITSVPAASSMCMPACSERCAPVVARISPKSSAGAELNYHGDGALQPPYIRRSGGLYTVASSNYSAHVRPPAAAGPFFDGDTPAAGAASSEFLSSPALYTSLRTASAALSQRTYANNKSSTCSSRDDSSRRIFPDIKVSRTEHSSSSAVGSTERERNGSCSSLGSRERERNSSSSVGSRGPNETTRPTSSSDTAEAACGRRVKVDGKQHGGLASAAAAVRSLQWLSAALQSRFSRMRARSQQLQRQSSKCSGWRESRKWTEEEVSRVTVGTTGGGRTPGSSSSNLSSITRQGLRSKRLKQQLLQWKQRQQQQHRILWQQARRRLLLLQQQQIIHRLLQRQQLLKERGHLWLAIKRKRLEAALATLQHPSKDSHRLHHVGSHVISGSLKVREGLVTPDKSSHKCEHYSFVKRLVLCVIEIPVRSLAHAAHCARAHRGVPGHQVQWTQQQQQPRSHQVYPFILRHIRCAHTQPRAVTLSI